MSVFGLALRHAASVALIAAGTALADGARADSRVIQGHSLTLTTTLSETTSIEADPGPVGSIRIEAEGGLDCLTVTGGEAPVIDTARCDSELSGLRIRIPAGTPLTLTVAGSGAVALGDLRSAPLHATLSGGGDLTAGAVVAPVLTLRSSGDVSLGESDGPAEAEVHGSGDLRIGRLAGTLASRQFSSGDVVVGTIAAGQVESEQHGSGDLKIGPGSIASLRASSTGSGDTMVAADVINAELSATGSGDMKLARVSGSLKKNTAGDATIEVGGAAAEAVSRAAQVSVSHDGMFDITVSRAEGMRAGVFKVLWHLVTLAVVVTVLVLVVRAIVRAGGIGTSARRRGAAPVSAAPAHPGVTALAELMQRLEQRLGRVEGYVTSREFDLQQKFRELK